MAARPRPNSVEYGNSKTTTLLPSAKCRPTCPLFQGRTGCGGRPSGWHDIVTCQRLVTFELQRVTLVEGHINYYQYWSWSVTYPRVCSIFRTSSDSLKRQPRMPVIGLSNLLSVLARWATRRTVSSASTWRATYSRFGTVIACNGSTRTKLHK